MGLSLSRDRRATAEEALLSVEQVAAICGLSRRAVYDAIKRGELPALKLCSRLRVRKSDLDAWFACSTVAARPSSPHPSATAGPLASPSRGSFRAKLREQP